MKCKNTECNNETENNKIYCSYSCRNIYVNKYLRDYTKISETLSKKTRNEYFKNVKKCLFCGEDLSYEKRNNKFCNSSCSASYNNEKIKNNDNYDEIRKIKNLKIKKSLYGRGHDDVELICKFCGHSFTVKYSKRKQKFCSKSCSSKYRMSKKENIDFMRWVGRKSAKTQSENRRSKNEIYFAKLCKKHFKNVRTNESIFNGWDADIIIDDIKVAILWNGKWHYEKITEKHSVKQVQNRDRIKVNEIKKYGYTPYIIKDMGKENKEFVEEQFNLFLNKY
jgi:hypothetical protein